MNSDKRRGRPKWFDANYEDLINDPELTKKISPIHHIEGIDSPVLLLHGDSDSVVKKRQSKRMKQALKNAGKEVELEILSWQGHSYGDEGQRAKTHRATAEFLREHMLD